MKMKTLMVVLLFTCVAAFGQANKGGKVLSYGGVVGFPATYCGFSAGVPILCPGTPSNQYIQANTVTDLFNRTATGLGSNWQNWANSFNTTNGTGAISANATVGIAAYNAVTSAPTQTVTVTVGTASASVDYVGAAVRISGTPTTSVNFYYCSESNTQLFMGKVTGASNSSQGTNTGYTAGVSITRAVGDVIKLQIVGNTLACSRNGQLLVQQNDASSPITTGLPGIVQNSAAGSTIGSFILTNTGEIPSNCTTNIVADGDSITYGYGLYNQYTDFLVGNSSMCTTNLGVSGKAVGVVSNALTGGSIESMITTGTSVVDTLYKPGATNILILWGGTNDISNAGQTVTQTYTSIKNYITARHTAGWKVILVPAISRVTSDNYMQQLDAAIYAGGTGADVVVALPPALTSPGQYGNTALFLSGGIHPTLFTDADIVAPLIQSAIGALL